MTISSHNPTFEVRPSVITGDTADVYLHRTLRILRNEGLNPTVVMEFSVTRSAVLCGTLEVKAILAKVTSEGNREMWAVEEGAEVAQNEVCLGSQGALFVVRSVRDRRLRNPGAPDRMGDRRERGRPGR